MEEGQGGGLGGMTGQKQKEKRAVDIRERCRTDMKKIRFQLKKSVFCFVTALTATTAIIPQLSGVVCARSSKCVRAINFCSKHSLPTQYINENVTIIAVSLVRPNVRASTFRSNFMGPQRVSSRLIFEKCVRS